MIELIPLHGLPEVQAGADLVELTLSALQQSAQGRSGRDADALTELRDGDVVVYTSKIVAKAEARVVALESITPSPFAEEWAAAHEKDPRHVEVVLREARRIVRMDRGVLIAETRHGFICANAGVDASNAGRTGHLILLPEDSDASARRLRQGLRERAEVDVAVIVSDTFGRPWRIGQTNIAVGAAGIAPLQSYIGQEDPEGLSLRVTSLAVIDELAGAAELVMGKLDRVPIAVIRGYDYPRPTEEAPDTGAASLARGIERDLFR